MAVDRGIGDVAQDLRRPVPARRQIEQLSMIVDELRRVAGVAESGVGDQVLKKGQVGSDTADTKLAQCPVHPGDRLVRRRRPGRDLFQQGVVKPRNHGPRIGGAAVQPNTETGGTAIGGDAAVVGNEIVHRVVGRDPTLQRVAAKRDLRLGRYACLLDHANAAALGDADLRLDDIDAGDFLGHRVLDLDPRIDLHEIEVAGIDILQELDRRGTLVVGISGDPQTEFAQLSPLLGRQIGCRRPFDDFLVAALDGTVALVQVDDVAVTVAEDLDLDMAGAVDQLFQIDRTVAEGGFGFAPSRQHLRVKLGFGSDRPHAASAAAPAGLQHQRIADLGRDRPHRGGILWQDVGRRDDRDAGGDGGLAGRNLVAEQPHGSRLWSDERDAVGLTGLGKVGVLRQEAIAWMDGVDAGPAGDADDLVDRQIGAHRAQSGAYLVGFVRFEAVQRQLVLFGVDRDGSLSQLVGSTKDPDGDFAPVCDENLTERHEGRFSRYGGGRRIMRHPSGKRLDRYYRRGGCRVFNPRHCESQ